MPLPRPVKRRIKNEIKKSTSTETMIYLQCFQALIEEGRELKTLN